MAWMPPRRQVRVCPSLPFKDCNSVLKVSCSEVPGPHVLLSSYATRVISCGPGVLSSFVTLPGLSLSGSSDLDWGSVELLRTYNVRFSSYECTLRPGLCLG